VRKVGGEVRGHVVRSGATGVAVLTTRRFALSRSELGTTAVAVVVSTTGYLLGGGTYLARGVVGDLVGFGLLAAVAVVRSARVRHEALICLAGIGTVVLAAPQWPLRVPQGGWWTAFSVGLGAYVLLRRGVCD